MRVLCVFGTRPEAMKMALVVALKWVSEEILSDPVIGKRIAARFPLVSDSRRMVLLTGHRRENLDGGLLRVFRAVRALAQSHDINVVYIPSTSIRPSPMRRRPSWKALTTST